MKILITNHHLQGYSGTEVSTFVLAKYLIKFKQDVTVYAKFVTPEFIQQFLNLGIRVITDIKLISTEKFDLGHIQHNICALEVRQAFPKLPLIMWIHGYVPYLESPPFMDLNISKFLVINKNIYNHVLKAGISADKIEIFRNLVDSEAFFETCPINLIPKTALVISNKITPAKEQILRKVLSALKIQVKFIGRRFEIIPNTQLNTYINQADIVFTLGLGAMEAMFSGRIPIIFDDNGGPYDDGMVTPDNFGQLMEVNFNGKARQQIFTEQILISEIQKYDARTTKILKQTAYNYYAAGDQAKKILNIYRDVASNFKPKEMTNEQELILNHVVQIIKITMNYAYQNQNQVINQQLNLIKLENQYLKVEKHQLQADLTKITSSKTYKLWQNFNKIKQKLSKY